MAARRHSVEFARGPQPGDTVLLSMLLHMRNNAAVFQYLFLHRESVQVSLQMFVNSGV